MKSGIFILASLLLLPLLSLQTNLNNIEIDKIDRTALGAASVYTAPYELDFQTGSWYQIGGTSNTTAGTGAKIGDTKTGPTSANPVKVGDAKTGPTTGTVRIGDTKTGPTNGTSAKIGDTKTGGVQSLFNTVFSSISNTSAKSGKGCTVPKADNYNPNALIDDGSCLGCLDKNNKEKYVGDIYVSKIRTINNTCAPRSGGFISDKPKQCITGIFGPEKEIVWLQKPRSSNENNKPSSPVNSLPAPVNPLATSTKNSLNLGTTTPSSSGNFSSPEKKDNGIYYYELSDQSVMVSASELTQSEIEILEKYGAALFDLQKGRLVQYDRETQDPYACQFTCQNNQATNYTLNGAHDPDQCSFSFQYKCLTPEKPGAKNIYTGPQPKPGEGKPIIRHQEAFCEYDDAPTESNIIKNCQTYTPSQSIEILYNPDDEPTHKSCRGFEYLTGGVTGVYSVVDVGGGIREVQCSVIKEICSDNDITKPKTPDIPKEEDEELCPEDANNAYYPKREGDYYTFVSGGECNLTDTPERRSFGNTPQNNNYQNNTPQPTNKPSAQEKDNFLKEWIKEQAEKAKKLIPTFDKDEKENKVQEDNAPEVEKTPEEKLEELKKTIEEQEEAERANEEAELELKRQEESDRRSEEKNKILDDPNLSKAEKEEALKDKLGMSITEANETVSDDQKWKQENPGKERPGKPDRVVPAPDPNFAKPEEKGLLPPPVPTIKPNPFVNNFNNPNFVDGAVAGNPPAQIPANPKPVEFPWQQEKPAGTPPSSLATEEKSNTNAGISKKEQDELVELFKNGEKTSEELSREYGFDLNEYLDNQFDNIFSEESSKNRLDSAIEKQQEFSEKTLREENPELDKQLADLDKKIAEEDSKIQKSNEAAKDDIDSSVLANNDLTLNELKDIQKEVEKQGIDQSIGIEAAKNKNQLQAQKEKLIQEATTQKQQVIDEETKKLLGKLSEQQSSGEEETKKILDKPLVTQGDLVVNKNGKLVLTEKPNIGSNTLREGSTGENVEALKTFLSGTGFLNPDQINSDFDTTTKNAVIEFQKSVGLEPDGIVGKNTKAVIDRLSESLVLQNQVLAQKENSISSDNKFVDTKIVKGEKIKIEGEIAAHTDGNNVFSHLSAWHQNQTSSGLPPQIPGVVLPRVDFSPDGKNSKIMTDKDGKPVGELGDVFLATFTNDYGQSVTKALVANETGGVWGPGGRYDDRKFGEFDISTMLDLKFNHDWGIGIDYQSLQMPAGTKVEIQKTNLNISNEEEYKDALEKLAKEGLITKTETTKVVLTDTPDGSKFEDIRNKFLENSTINKATGKPHGDRSLTRGATQKPLVTQSSESTTEDDDYEPRKLTTPSYGNNPNTGVDSSLFPQPGDPKVNYRDGYGPDGKIEEEKVPKSLSEGKHLVGGLVTGDSGSGRQDIYLEDTLETNHFFRSDSPDTDNDSNTPTFETKQNTSNKPISEELLDDIMDLYLGIPEEDRPTIEELAQMIEDGNIAGLYPNNTKPSEQVPENKPTDKTQPVANTDQADQIVEALLSQDKISPGDLEKAINKALGKSSPQEDLVVLNNEDTGFNFPGIVDGVIGNALGFLGSLLPEGLGGGRDQNNAKPDEEELDSVKDLFANLFSTDENPIDPKDVTDEQAKALKERLENSKELESRPPLTDLGEKMSPEIATEIQKILNEAKSGEITTSEEEKQNLLDSLKVGLYSKPIILPGSGKIAVPKENKVVDGFAGEFLESTFNTLAKLLKLSDPNNIFPEDIVTGPTGKSESNRADLENTLANIDEMNRLTEEKAAELTRSIEALNIFENPTFALPYVYERSQQVPADQASNEALKLDTYVNELIKDGVDPETLSNFRAELLKNENPDVTISDIAEKYNLPPINTPTPSKPQNIPSVDDKYTIDSSISTGPTNEEKTLVTQSNENKIKFPVSENSIFKAFQSFLGIETNNADLSIIPTSITQINPLPDNFDESNFEPTFDPSIFAPGDVREYINIEEEYPSLNRGGLSPQNPPLSPPESEYDRPIFSSPAVKNTDTNLRAVPIPESDLQPQDRNGNWIKESGLQIEGEYKGIQPTVPKGSEELFNLSKYLESVGIEF